LFYDPEGKIDRYICIEIIKILSSSTESFYLSLQTVILYNK